MKNIEYRLGQIQDLNVGLVIDIQGMKILLWKLWLLTILNKTTLKTNNCTLEFLYNFLLIHRSFVYHVMFYECGENKVTQILDCTYTVLSECELSYHGIVYLFGK